MGRLSRILGWTAAAAAALIPCAAPADPLLTFGPDVPLFITASESVRRDTNVYLTQQNTQADTIFIFIPGVEFHWSGSQASLAITASEQFSRYAKIKNLNDHLADLTAASSYAGTYVSFSANASFVQQDQTSIGAQSSEQTVSHSVGLGALNTEVTVGPNTHLGLGGMFERTTYAQAGYIGTDEWSFPVDLYYALTPKTDLSLGYRSDLTRLDNGIGNSDASFYNIGARGSFTPKLSGQVRVGITELHDQSGQKSHDLGLSASLDYQATSNTKVDLSSGSGFTTSPVGTSERVFSVGLSASTQLSQAWGVSAGGSYQSTDYLYALARKDGFWVGNLGVNYTWTTTTGFQLAYVFRKNDSTLDSAVFNDNVLTLSAASRF